MIIKGREAALLGKAVCLGLGLVALFACADKGIPIKELRGQIQGGSKRSLEQVFAAKRPIVALVDNKKGTLFAATDSGDVFAIKDVNQAVRIYRGLEVCENSWSAFALSKEGKLVANICRGGKDMLVSISDKGEVNELTAVKGRVLSLAQDSRGKIYAGVWMSEGNISISLNPRALAGAEFIVGKILEINPGIGSNMMYEGALPVWISVSRSDTLYASLWGQKGYFAPEKKTYAYIDPYRAYWLALSDRVQFVNMTGRVPRFTNSLIDSLSLFLIPDDDYMLGYGIDRDGEGGLYLIEENRPPIRLLLEDQKLDKNITSLALFEDVVYFGNLSGHVYRIK